jgi:DNA-directed RNA polymerase subunit RPC12/RpoP
MIQKLERKSNGCYELAEVPAKINEIIDVLNELIRDDAVIVGQLPVTSADLFDTPKDMSINACIDNNVYKPASIYDGIKCPKCGSTHFMVGPSVSTCVYYPPIIKDGVNINPDRNKCTTQYECLECRHAWSE